MADITSRINLQATGGDQVAREIGKVKQAYQEAAGAAKGMSASAEGGGTDPFTKATSGVDQGSAAAGRAGPNQDLHAAASGRESQHRNLAYQNQAFAARMNQGVRGVGGAATQVFSGDPLGGASSSMMMLGGAGALGVLGLVGGMALSGINRMSERDLDEKRTLYTGLGQRLGQTNYGQFRDYINSIRERGLGTHLEGYMQMLAQSGGRFDPGMADAILQFEQDTGVQSSVLARLMGRMTQAGAEGTAQHRLAGEGRNAMAFQARSAFGQAGMTDFYSTIASAVENAMRSGFREGSDIFTSMYTTHAQRLADLANYGGATPLGAQKIFGQVQQSFQRSASGLSGPMDTMAFMALREPGESYMDTMMKVTDPSNDLAVYRSLRARTGARPGEPLSKGQRDMLTILVSRQFNINYREAQTYIDGAEGREELRRNPRGIPEGAVPTADQTVQDQLGARATMQETGRGVREGATEAITDTVDAVRRFGQWVLPGSREDNIVSQAFANPSYQALQREISQSARMDLFGNRNWERFTSDTPGSLQWLMNRAYGDPDFTGLRVEKTANRFNSRAFYDDFMPQLTMYGRYKRGETTGMTNAQLQYFEQYGGAFEEVSGLLQGMRGKFDDPNANAIGQLSQAINTANRVDNLDLREDIVSIIDILAAVRNLAEEWGTATMTDDGATN